MNVDWRVFARAFGADLDGSTVTVQLAGERTQRVFVEADRTGVALRLWSVVTTKSKTALLGGGAPLAYAWERNRLSDLVGYTVDNRGRLIGETWIPTDGITQQTFTLHLEELARVCDWHEMRLSGDDTH